MSLRSSSPVSPERERPRRATQTPDLTSDSDPFSGYIHFEGRFEAASNSKSTDNGKEGCPKCRCGEKSLANWEIQGIQSAYNKIREVMEWVQGEQKLDELSVDEVGIDLYSQLNTLGPANAKEAESLRIIILGLNAKLKVLQLGHKEIDTIRDHLLSSQRSREDLEMSAQEAAEELRKQIENLGGVHNQILEERNQAFSDLREYQTSYTQKVHECEKLTEDLQFVKDELDSLKVEKRGFHALKDELHSSLDKVLQDYADRDNLREKLKKCVDEMENQHCKQQSSIQQLNGEIEQLQSKIHTLESKQQDMELEKAELFQMNKKLEDELHQTQEELQAADNGFQVIRQLQDKLKLAESKTASLQQQLANSAQTFQSQLDSLVNIQQALVKKNKELSEKSNSLQAQLDSKDFEIDSLKREKIDLNTELAGLEQHLCVREDMNQILDDLTNQSQAQKESVDLLGKELNMMSEYCMAQSERNLASNRAVTKLKDILDEKETELDVLREMVVELQKQKPCYVPMKEDAIDCALADYINTRMDPLEVPFTREEVGIYLFGTKRVFIKLENGKIIIRVGGGFMLIDEFVQIYTPLELEKFEYKKREDKSTKRKAVLGKIIENSVGDKQRVKLNTNISPQRAAKIIKETLESGNTPFATCYAVAKRPPSPTKTPSSARSPNRSMRKSQSNLSESSRFN